LLAGSGVGDPPRAADLLRRKHPVLQGVLVPLSHRVLRCGTAYYELREDVRSDAPR
jgi:uncharacterized protein